MKVLLIYEEKPERTRFFSLIAPTSEQLDVLEEAQGKMVNMNDLSDEAKAACDKICQAISKPEHLPEPDDEYNTRYEGWGSIWLAKEIPVMNLPAEANGPWDRVYYTGFWCKLHHLRQGTPRSK